MDVTQRCFTFVARLLPGPVRRYPEPDDPADGEYSYWGERGSLATADAPRAAWTWSLLRRVLRQQTESTIPIFMSPVRRLGDHKHG